VILALPKTQSVTFEELVQWKPEEKYYKLQSGVIVEMNQPSGQHEWIIIFLNKEITSESTRLDLCYGIAKTVLVKPPESQSAYLPDVLLVNPVNLANEPLWEKQATVTQAASIPLVIEVVSTN
jgi:Uma2 family endonuclease